MKKFMFSALRFTFLLLLPMFTVGCNQKETEQPSASHTHAYVEYVVSPTCTAEGYTLHKCECGEEYRDNTVSKLGHSLSGWQTVKQATETEQGLKTRKCTRSGCDYSENENIPQLAHTHKFTEQTATEKYLKSPATCTEKAKYYYSCKCGEKGNNFFETGDKRTWRSAILSHF